MLWKIVISINIIKCSSLHVDFEEWPGRLCLSGAEITTTPPSPRHLPFNWNWDELLIYLYWIRTILSFLFLFYSHLIWSYQASYMYYVILEDLHGELSSFFFFIDRRKSLINWNGNIRLIRTLILNLFVIFLHICLYCQLFKGEMKSEDVFHLKFFVKI